MNIYLTGLQGVGKTLYGKRLAALLHRSFFDIDEVLVKKHKASSVRALYQQHGEEWFRQEEEKVALDLLKKNNCVIAFGGGTITSPRVQRALTKGRLVYLYRPYEWFLAKWHKELPSYLIGKNVQETFRQRDKLNRFLAHIIIDLNKECSEEGKYDK